MLQCGWVVKLLKLLKIFMTTVLFRAYQVATQNLSPFLPLGKFFLVAFKAVYELHPMQQ